MNIAINILKKLYWILPFSAEKKRWFLDSLRSRGIFYTIFNNANFVNVQNRELAQKFKIQVLEAPRKRNVAYESECPQRVPLSQSSPKLIAYYLTQFHPNEKNDLWWGRGVTEWNNVFRAVPQFIDHDQPRIPGELGAYDLRLKENLQRQIELAKNAGIYAFSFYYYWFSGERLLEKPLDLFLGNDDLDMNFMLCWANESWTKRFDGTSQEVLMEFKTDFESNKDFILSVKDVITDTRYVKISGKPVIQIYRPSKFDDVRQLLSYWRNSARELQVGEIHFMAVSFGADYNIDFRSMGFDSVSDFHPGSLLSKNVFHNINDQIEIVNEKFVGHVYDYSDVALNSAAINRNNVYPAVMPTWDNSARRVDSGMIFHGSTPSLYGTWLREACSHTLKQHELVGNFVFLNAWNEWGEGAYLEPDKNFGYAYLNETKRIMKEFING